MYLDKNNTIIVLVSDHGWQMGEKDYLFKNSPWEESTRIPYIIKTPNGEAGVKVNHPVSLIDIYPTLKELCNLTGDNRFNEKGGTLDGHSLKPFLDNPETKNWDGPDGALSMIGVGLNSADVIKQTYSYRTKNWRYILYPDGTEELYNEKTDPFEWENIAGDKTYSPQKKRLKTDMLEIINQHK